MPSLGPPAFMTAWAKVMSSDSDKERQVCIAAVAWGCGVLVPHWLQEPIRKTNKGSVYFLGRQRISGLGMFRSCCNPGTASIEQAVLWQEWPPPSFQARCQTCTSKSCPRANSASSSLPVTVWLWWPIPVTFGKMIFCVMVTSSWGKGTEQSWGLTAVSFRQ